VVSVASYVVAGYERIGVKIFVVAWKFKFTVEFLKAVNPGTT
jgi:hypothetical protein